MNADPARLRDDLLAVARDAVRSAELRGADPLLAGEAIVDAWLDHQPDLEVVDPSEHTPPGAIAADPAFRPEPRGVESLAFLVVGPRGGTAAGIILRIPGEYPDSFEAVRMPDPPTTHSSSDAIRAAFYG